MTARDWTTHEVRVLRAYAGLGRDAVAAILERTPHAVAAAARSHGISLRVSEDDLETQAEALNTLERIREAPGLDVCPMCGKRFARMRASGLCRCCHLDQLLELHQERIDEEIRLRRLDKARQDKRRLRVCSSCGEPYFPRPDSPVETCRDCGP